MHLLTGWKSDYVRNTALFLLVFENIQMGNWSVCLAGSLPVEMGLKCNKCKPVSHEALLLTHSCDSWQCGGRTIFSPGNRSLQLLWYTCRKLGCCAVLSGFTAGNKNKLLGCICTEKFWFPHHWFCSISKQMEKQYFSNCCSVCNLFSQ